VETSYDTFGWLTDCVELLVAMSVMLILVAAAIPSYLSSIRSSHEAAAVSAISAISTAEYNYSQMFPAVGYSATLTALGGASCLPGTTPTIAASCLLDSNLAGGNRSGYAFTYAASAGSGTVNSFFSVSAVPLNAGISGARGFYGDSSGVVTYSLTGTAPTSASSALGN